jgi:hypothetical protein
VGLSREEAEREARKETSLLYIADADDPASSPHTADFRQDRLNLIVQQGHVVRAFYG